MKRNGYCTDGFLVAASELLDGDGPVTEGRIRTVLSGNLCGCTGYETIADTVLSVARTREKQR